jgi:hypothetical protein
MKSFERGETLPGWRDKLSGCPREELAFLVKWLIHKAGEQTIIAYTAACQNFWILLFKLSPTSRADKQIPRSNTRHTDIFASQIRAARDNLRKEGATNASACSSFMQPSNSYENKVSKQSSVISPA